MTVVARAPEDVDPMLEDAFVLGDEVVLRGLYDDRALLVDGRGVEARGPAAIARVLPLLRAHDAAYVSRTRHVARNGDGALVVADGGIHVLRRAPDGSWRVTITLLDPSTGSEES